MYQSKYGFFEPVNKTVLEKRKALDRQTRAENRRYDPEKHKNVKDWSERDFFRVFYDKDHAARNR